MTYCLAIKADNGLVFASDSHPGAGMDQAIHRSMMHVFTPANDRIFVLLGSGDPATVQRVVSQIRLDLDGRGSSNGFKTFDHLFDLADYIGVTNRRMQERGSHSPQQESVNPEVSYILGGQIGTQEHEMFLIYPEGNFITVSPAKPYLQIGESKYGKPILDRMITPETNLGDAVRCAVISLDSTIRSNPSVDPPFHLAVYRNGRFELEHRTLDVESLQYQAMTQGWNDGLKRAFTRLPRFEWE